MVRDLHLSSSSSSGIWDSLQLSESSQESEAVQLSHQKGQGMSLVLQALHPLQSELAMLRSPRDPQTYDPPTAVHTNEFSTRFWTTNHGSYWHLLCKCTIRSLSQVVPRNGAPGWIEVHWSTWRSLPSESNVGSLTRRVRPSQDRSISEQRHTRSFVNFFPLATRVPGSLNVPGCRSSPAPLPIWIGNGTVSVHSFLSQHGMTQGP